MPPLPGPTVVQPRSGLPVLLSVPHAGRDYPAWLIDLASSGRASLEPLEDPLVDALAEPALALGLGAVIARAPRAAIDCNRAEDEIDPCVVAASPGRRSERARGGLGIVPGRTASHGALWRRPITLAELEQRLDLVHRPYHRALEQELALIAARFGGALLLDCHSMPPPARGTPPIVFGDRFGRSAAPWIASSAIAIARSAGFDAAVNEPFAGGHVVERHGVPGDNVHALQIEVDRRCYLADGAAARPGPGFDRVAALLARLAAELGRQLLARPLPQAAE